MDDHRMNHPDSQNLLPDTCFPTQSTEKAAQQYQGKSNARKYAIKITKMGTDKREKKCILEALKIAGISPDSHVLDCPCGPGRLIPLLKKAGFKITAADISAGMLDEARMYAGPMGLNCLDEKDKLGTANLFDTGFESGRFDGVICHRVFQYFSEPRERILALSEIHRISKGPVIVSFLCSWSVDTLWRKILCALHLLKKRKNPPISPFRFSSEIHSARFKVKRWIAMRPFLSKRWYAVLEPAKVQYNGILNTYSSYRRIIFAAVQRIAACVLAVILPFLAYNFFVDSDSVRYNQIEKIAKQYYDGDETLYITKSTGLNKYSLSDKNIKITNLAQINENIITEEKESKFPLFILSNKEMETFHSYPVFAKLEFVRKVKIGTNNFYLLRTPDTD